MTLNFTDIEFFKLLMTKIGERDATAVKDYEQPETVETVIETNEVLRNDFSSMHSFLKTCINDFWVYFEK